MPSVLWTVMLKSKLLVTDHHATGIFLSPCRCRINILSFSSTLPACANICTWNVQVNSGTFSQVAGEISYYCVAVAQLPLTVSSLYLKATVFNYWRGVKCTCTLHFHWDVGRPLPPPSPTPPLSLLPGIYICISSCYSICPFVIWILSVPKIYHF